MQWVTRDARQPAVQWGTAPGQLSQSAVGDSTTYTRADMCGPPANTTGWVEPGLLHGAVMAGLAPSTRYYYRYGDQVGEGLRAVALRMGCWVEERVVVCGGGIGASGARWAGGAGGVGGWMKGAAGDSRLPARW